MRTWEEFCEAMAGLSQPLGNRVQSVQHSYNPGDVHQRCGTCGQPLDAQAAQSGECPVCGSPLNPNNQMYDSRRKKVMASADTARAVPTTGQPTRWAQSRGFQ